MYVSPFPWRSQPPVVKVAKTAWKVSKCSHGDVAVFQFEPLSSFWREGERLMGGAGRDLHMICLWSYMHAFVSHMQDGLYTQLCKFWCQRVAGAGLRSDSVRNVLDVSQREFHTCLPFTATLWSNPLTHKERQLDPEPGGCDCLLHDCLTVLSLKKYEKAFCLGRFLSELIMNHSLSLDGNKRVAC